MNTNIVIPFPRTPRLLETNSTTDDIIISPEIAQSIFSLPLTVQEKIDGSNIGISYDSNAGETIFHRSGTVFEDDVLYKQFFKWMNIRRDEVFDTIKDRYILFGEWLFWKHNIPYDRLPSYFLAHDICDKKTGQFLNSENIEDILKDTQIKRNKPLATKKKLDLSDLYKFASQPSLFSTNGRREGIYMRVEGKRYTRARAKLVNEWFTKSLDGKEHWSKNLEPNFSLDPIEQYWAYNPKQSNL